MITFLCLAAQASTLQKLGPQIAGRLPNGPHSELFYWLTPARSGKADVPLLIWLNGGPGSSSMMGFLMELGPYAVLPDGSGVIPRTISWNDNLDVLFIDQPAGTGFSVATAPEGYVDNQTAIGTSFVAFLNSFYAKYPKYLSQPLWITGESYAGKYIPAIVTEIISRRLHVPRGDGGLAKIPLKGIAIGNGLTRPREMTLSVPDSYYAVGLLDGAQRKKAAALAADCVSLIDAASWTAATHARSVLFHYIANANGPKSAPSVYDFRVYGEYNETALGIFLNLNETKAWLNLPSEAQWSQHSDEVHRHLNDDIMKPYSQLLPPILDAGLPVLLYQGQMDLRDGVAATEAWLPTMKWKGLDAWLAAPRATWVSPANATEPYDHTQPAIAGYVRSCRGLTHMTVGGAGHLVPMDQPERAQDMIQRFVSGEIRAKCS